MVFFPNLPVPDATGLACGATVALLVTFGACPVTVAADFDATGTKPALESPGRTCK